MNKPKLDQNIAIIDFNDHYWLKEELVLFCKKIGINSSGRKIAIANRINSFLENGEIAKDTKKHKTTIHSTFDWNNEALTLETHITDNYKNTENVREFFLNEIGKHFKFNVAFMKWMKDNEGKILQDAIQSWIALAALKKDKNYKTEIAPQFEYNIYMRDFLLANPHLTSKDAMNSWKIKRDKPGDKKYSNLDLLFLKINSI